MFGQEGPGISNEIRAGAAVTVSIAQFGSTRSVNAAVEFTYRNAWSFEVRYVNFFGAGRFNLLTDRDYVATTVKYSF